MQQFKLVFLIAVMFFISLNTEAARPKKKELKQIEQLLQNQNYDKAMDILAKGLKKFPQHVEYNFMMGVCYYYNNSCSPISIKHLEKALGNARKRKMIVEIKHYLGKAYHSNKMFDKAIDIYQSLKKDIAPKNYKLKKEIKRLIESSQYARRMCQNPVNIKVVSLGDHINSKYMEHSPSVSADEQFMVFTSRRETEGGKKDLDGQYFEDIYSSHHNGENWNAPRRIKELSTPGHDASVSLSADGRTMLLYRADINSRTTVAGDIFISYREGDKWSKPEKLKGGINTSYKESHAAFSRDGKTIYFTSNRPGGKGGMDIYMSQKNKKGEWQRPKNLGDVINTEYDEVGPFFHPDGKTLFFSSKGHKTIGGFDIFSSEKRGGGWTPPENMGYPINSLLDDIYYTPTTDGKRAYFASARQGGKGKLDLYLMKLKDFSAKKIFVIRGTIGNPSKDQDFDDYRIIVRTKDGKEGVYSPDPSTGEYLYIISADKDYDIEFARKGYQTLYTKVKIPYEYYNDKNHGVVTFNRIKLLTYKGGYTRPDLSINIYKLGFPPSAGMLPVINDKKAILIIKNLGVKRRKFEQPPVNSSDAKSSTSNTLGAAGVGSLGVGAEAVNKSKSLAALVSKNKAGKRSQSGNVVSAAALDEYYTVQVKAMHKDLPLSYFEKRGMTVVKINCKDGLHRYIMGKYTNPKAAGKALKKIRKTKVPDAFIRKMKGNKIGSIVPRRLWR